MLDPPLLKGPGCTKNTTRSKVTTRSEFTMRSDFFYRDDPCANFPWVFQTFPPGRRGEGVANSKLVGIVETLWLKNSLIFCVAVVFSKVRLGPLGIAKTSGKKKEPKPKLSGPDIFPWDGGIPCEGLGAKSSVCPSKPREKANFLVWCPGNLPGCPDKSPKSLTRIALQGRANHEVQTVNWNAGIFGAESA